MREISAWLTRFRWLFVLCLLASPAAAKESPHGGQKPAATTAVPGATETATFAGGCFWCMETAFEGKPGVLSVISGFSGGPEKNPTYPMVSSGKTGHMESVQVVFDPKRTSYGKLLDTFWHNIDPTQGDGQFCDHGKQYRSAIFWRGETQHQLAVKSKRALENSKRFKHPIVTQVLEFTAFYPAEEYHQDYYKKNPENYYAYRKGCGRDRRLQEIWGKDAPPAQSH